MAEGLMFKIYSRQQNQWHGKDHKYTHDESQAELYPESMALEICEDAGDYEIDPACGPMEFMVPVVTACNSHDALVNILKKAVLYLDEERVIKPHSQAHAELRDALIAAGVEVPQ